MLEILNKLLWSVATIFILLSGIYYTFKLKFIQFRFIKMIKALFKKESDSGIKSYQTLMMVLAGRIGVGSIAGVALAIHYGGVGTIFWMWIVAILGAVNSFVETALGVLYKEKDGKNLFKGGPSYYIKNGLNKKWLGGIYAIIILISYVGGFLSIQSNTITKSINQICHISPYLIATLICLITFFIIFGGIKRIASISSKLVPFMTISYVLVALYCIIVNINIVPTIILKVVTSAFNLNSFLSSFIPTLLIGIQRGIFSNEAGLGTGAIASSTVKDNNPIRQGFVQMIGVYITTLIICTSTAMIILTSPYNELLLSDINGVEITQFAFSYHLGEFGNYFIFLSIILFSFTTVLTGYYDGESSLKYFFGDINKKHLLLLKICTIFVLFIGCVISASKIWLYVDIMVAIEAIINIYAIFMLRDKLIKRIV